MAGWRTSRRCQGIESEPHCWVDNNVTTTPVSSGLNQTLAPFPSLPPWARQALLLSAGGLAVDVAVQGLHGGGSWLGLGALAGGWLWMAQRQVGRSIPLRPKTVESWGERCHAVLEDFAELDPDPAGQGHRSSSLQELLSSQGRTTLKLALAGSAPLPEDRLLALQMGLQGQLPLQLVVGDPLPTRSPRWRWSAPFASSDVLLFHLQPPLTAANLRWLEALPGDLPVWVLLEADSTSSSGAWLAELRSQWPDTNPERILFWNGDLGALSTSLVPLTQWLSREGKQLPHSTLCRCLEHLHGTWQADLERLRRIQWRQLQQRTQWLVAGGVLVTPSASLDLLVLSVANGLMLREMARLWSCPWTMEHLKTAALHLGKAALALGVVEWSSQAVAGAFKLHGGTWLVGGSLQALSAAYLTRVIGHAMADLMARSAGVSEPDLEAIKAEAPLLVAKAAEAEKLNWGGFLQEARGWLIQQGQPIGREAT